MTTVPTPQPPTVNTVVVDLRGLQPPEPMQRVLETLARLPADTTLVVHLHREPVFLFQILQPDGWSHSSRCLEPEHWEIGIWRAEDRRRSDA